MKSTIISIIFAGALIAGSVLMSNSDSIDNIRNVDEPKNVSIVDGIQFIDFRAKGGYSPRKSIAQAGIPTIIRITTSGTYDCSAAVRIPSMNILKILPQTGGTEIDIGTSTQGILEGSCGMGMYPFEIDFK